MSLFDTVQLAEDTVNVASYAKALRATERGARMVELIAAMLSDPVWLDLGEDEMEAVCGVVLISLQRPALRPRTSAELSRPQGLTRDAGAHVNSNAGTQPKTS